MGRAGDIDVYGIHGFDSASLAVRTDTHIRVMLIDYLLSQKSNRSAEGFKSCDDFWI